MAHSDTSAIDHISASEKYRFETFDCFPNFTKTTRHQLALAGFIYRDSQCVCPQCGVDIKLEHIDENQEYAANHFRRLHRKKVCKLGKRCSFLLCEVGTNIDDLREQSLSHKQLQWNDAEVPEHVNYATRLQSFETWPNLQIKADGAMQTFVTPETLAKHGFYFSGPNDGVTCFYCGNTLVDWSKTMSSSNENIVQLEHARFFPCRFVTYTAGGKFVANAGFFHTVQPEERSARNPMSSDLLSSSNQSDKIPQTVDECLATYVDWPSDAPISPVALADAGFYSLGDGMKVKCFMCGVEVNEWHHGMTAIGAHRKRKNDCEIILAIDSTKTGNFENVNEKWRLETFHNLTFSQSQNDDNVQNEIEKRLCCELAACGFYRFKGTNKIRCAYCGVVIEPKEGQSIMSQHRIAAKKRLQQPQHIKINHSELQIVDCILVRAQCPANIPIPHRQRFPEHPAYQSVFDRIKTFESLAQRSKMTAGAIRETANAGFFLDEFQHIRCFQCGNRLPFSYKAAKKKFPEYDMSKLHAKFYPTCEWVKEILGAKYVAQVLYDRNRSKIPTTQMSYNAQSSSSSSLSQATTQSHSSIETPSVIDVTSPSAVNNFTRTINSDYNNDTSDDEGLVTVAKPENAIMMPSKSQVRSPLTPGSIYETSTTAKAQPCIDLTSNQLISPWASPNIGKPINPFEQWALYRQNQENREHISSSSDPSQESSPITRASSPASTPVDLRLFLAYESNRLETFKKLKREKFAEVNVKHLAYVGFSLNGEGTAIECSWCKIRLTEQKYCEIANSRPAVAGSPISDEPWTPMRVHRHANGVLIDQNNSWCTFVRREAVGIYQNNPLPESQMLYPEFPAYIEIEKRSQSFTSEWPYPGGSRLSNQVMAEAGFFYMGSGGACCYYCGNKLQSFEPRDCPFEEHATFFPLCDFIQKVRGVDYINRILSECVYVPNGRLKYEINGTQKIKRITYEKSATSKLKQQRPPASVVRKSSSTYYSMHRSYSNVQTIEDACILCTDKAATHEYDPCQHVQMCGECFARLDQEHLQTCMHCLQPATIRIRSPSTPVSP